MQNDPRSRLDLWSMPVHMYFYATVNKYMHTLDECVVKIWSYISFLIVKISSAFKLAKIKLYFTIFAMFPKNTLNTSIHWARWSLWPGTFDIVNKEIIYCFLNAMVANRYESLANHGVIWMWLVVKCRIVKLWLIVIWLLRVVLLRIFKLRRIVIAPCNLN